MIRFRRFGSLISENSLLKYENTDYGFSIKYPDHWYEDELNQKEDGYIKVVELRKFIDDKHPFVTIYIEQLESKNESALDYIKKGIKELENDPSVSILERSEVEVDNNLRIRLVDVDDSGYKRMVYWIPSMIRSLRYLILQNKNNICKIYQKYKI